MRRGLQLVVLILFLVRAGLGQVFPPDVVAAQNTIRPEALRAEMRFLSDGMLEGRNPGTRGYDLAALYVATQLEAIGLKPGGADGSWYQQVPLRRARILEERSSIELLAGSNKQVLIPGKDYAFMGDLYRTESSVSAPLVYVGFGVTAPEFEHDDYANIDARGKVVVLLWNAPASFPASQRAYYSDSTVKARNAVEHGAIGIISIFNTDDAKRLPWDFMSHYLRMGQRQWIEADGTPHDAFPQLRFRAMLNLNANGLLFSQSGRTLTDIYSAAEGGMPASFSLPWTVNAHTYSKHEEFKSANIVGLLSGDDAKLREQYITYSAHLDHMGLCTPVDGDNVCHGAWDNASGVATLLETARAFQTLPRAPRRSIAFVIVTGEEGNLEGSDYFARFPTLPGRVVANLNVDGTPGMLSAAKDLVAYGAEHSDLNENAARAARQTGFDLSADPIPEENLFVRSDQYSFVKQGVPSLFVSDGTEHIEVVKQWLITKYHTPLDRIDQGFDFDAAVKSTRMIFLLGWDVAQQDAEPAWNRSDFFGGRFSRTPTNTMRTSAR